MSVLIVYTISCHCGADAETTTLDLSNPQPDGRIVIDLEMAAGQKSFRCTTCRCTYFSDELPVWPETECRSEVGNEEQGGHGAQ